MKVKFSRCTSSNLANVPQVDGQLIYTKDTGEVYLDVGNNRRKLSDVIEVTNKSSVVSPIITKLYYETSTDTLYKAKIVENNNEEEIVWVDITGATVQYVDTNFLKKDNTTAYTPVDDYNPATKKYVDDNCIPYQPFPAGLDTSHTTSAFMTSIRALNLPAGSTYLGGVTLTDMPFNGNAEVEIYVYLNNVIYLTLRSANISPYMWECNSHTFRGWEAIDKTAKDYANTNFLKKDNMTAYTPTGDYNPATKQYIDVRYERLKSTFPTTTGTGQTIALNKTAELEFKKPPLPMGNSEQFTTTGKNLLLLETLTEQTVNDVTFTPVYKNGLLQYINVNGTSTANARYYLNASQSDSYYPITFYGLAYNTDYYISGGISDQSVYIFFGGNDITDVVNYTGDTSGSFAENGGYRLCLRVDSGKTITNQRIYPMVRLQTVSDNSYEPYTGGQVSPNPDYPQEITNVTGDVEVVVENKNLIDINNPMFRNTILRQWGSAIGVSNVSDVSQYIKVIPNTQYTLSLETADSNYRRICFYKQPLLREEEQKDNTRFINYTEYLENTKTFATPNECNYIRVAYLNSASKVQLEKSSTATDYVEHKSQTFTFPLGNEKLMLGDYLADDGKHHVRGQIIFDGSESWYAYTDKNTQSYYCYYTNAPSDCIVAQEETNLVKCNVLPEGTWDDIYGKRHDTPIIALRDNKRFYVRVPFATLTEWETYISQQYTNETPVTIEYKLAEEQIVPYTSAQQTVYNAIKQALSYEGQTNISSNQNAIFNVEAYLGTKIILTNYVKKTDYAKKDVGGLIKTGNGFSATSNGYLTTSSYTYPEYITKANAIFIGKGTLETIISSSILKTGSTAPTTSTVGYRVGQLYLNTADNKLYQLTSIDGTDPNNIIYNWQQIINNADLANTVGQINSVLDSINGVEV